MMVGCRCPEHLIGSKGLLLGSTPNWHSLLLPHPMTFTSVVKATVWLEDAATSIAFIPGTATGRMRSVVVPSPSCPSPLAPHAHTLKSSRIAKLASPPAALVHTLFRPTTLPAAQRDD